MVVLWYGHMFICVGQILRISKEFIALNNFHKIFEMKTRLFSLKLFTKIKHTNFYCGVIF